MQLRIYHLKEAERVLSFEASEQGGLFEGETQSGYKRFGGFVLLGVSEEDIDDFASHYKGIVDPDFDYPALLKQYIGYSDPEDEDFGSPAHEWGKVNDGVVVNVSYDPYSPLSPGKDVQRIKEYPAAPPFNIE